MMAFKPSENTFENFDTLLMQRRADLHHARAAQDMFKRIATGINAACADDLDGRIQSLVERVDVGKRGRFDVFTAYAAKAVF